MFIAIDENLKPYVTNGSNRIYSYRISEDSYKKVLNICLNIFGEELCRKSAFTYAQMQPVFEKNHYDGTVTLTGEFFNGTKKPPGNDDMFTSFFLHEKGFEFKKINSYDIDNIPIDFVYENLSPIWKEKWNGLFLCMQPGGQWWISNGMEYFKRINGWQRFDSDVYFSVFDMFEINPVDDCTKKYYLRNYKNVKDYENN